MPMARLARLNIADIPQHIVQRGNNRQATFFADDDYAVYLDKLHEYANQHGVAAIAHDEHQLACFTPSSQQPGRHYG